MKKIILLFIFTVQSNIVLAGDAMTQNIMETIIEDISQTSRGKNGHVEFIFKDVKMHLISDVKHDRMRIITAITQYKNVTKVQIDAMMKSNFHTALDARYGVSDGVLYSAYIHPLSTLSRDQIKSAVSQVATLAMSFGKGYSSGVLSFRE